MDVRDAIEQESQRLEESTLFGEKGHQRAAAMWSRLHYFLGVPATVGSLIAGIAAVRGEDWAATVVFVVAGVTALMTFLVPQSRAQPHWKAMNQFNALRVRVRQFRVLDVYGGADAEELRASVDQMSAEKDRIQQQSPPVPYLAYRSARRAIANGEAEYAIDMPLQLEPGQRTDNGGK